MLLVGGRGVGGPCTTGGPGVKAKAGTLRFAYASLSQSFSAPAPPTTLAPAPQWP